jgi:hypothetical protein
MARWAKKQYPQNTPLDMCRPSSWPNSTYISSWPNSSHISWWPTSTYISLWPNSTKDSFWLNSAYLSSRPNSTYSSSWPNSTKDYLWLLCLLFVRTQHYILFLTTQALHTSGHDPILPTFRHDPSSLDKGYDPLYSSSPLASLDGFS